MTPVLPYWLALYPLLSTMTWANGCQESAGELSCEAGSLGHVELERAPSVLPFLRVPVASCLPQISLVSKSIPIPLWGLVVSSSPWRQENRGFCLPITIILSPT